MRISNPRRQNRSTSEAQRAARRWAIFSNGREGSRQWPWGEDLRVELPAFEWPTRWDYLGAAREVLYTSDKIMPENPEGNVIGYHHQFTRAEPMVEVFAPRGLFPFGEDVLTREIRRSTFAKGKGPQFPGELAFLAKLDGLSVSPPGIRAPCSQEKAKAVLEEDCERAILCASPEGDMLVALDGDDEFNVALVWVGPTLRVGSDGIFETNGE